MIQCIGSEGHGIAVERKQNAKASPLQSVREAPGPGKEVDSCREVTPQHLVRLTSTIGEEKAPEFALSKRRTVVAPELSTMNGQAIMKRTAEHRWDKFGEDRTSLIVDEAF